MAQYLLKFKGKYRVLAELDLNTMDFPRDSKGEIEEDCGLYIDCHHGNKIVMYGHHGGRVVLQAYIPSLQRGRNIKKKMDTENLPYFDYHETDTEVEFKFKAIDIDQFAELVKAKTTGAKISPFSTKNLPKANVEIPLEKLNQYKAVIASVQKGDLLIIHRITDGFLASILTKKYKKNNRSFSYQQDMRKLMMSRMAKEYIWTKGMWEEYLKYLAKEIKKFYDENHQ